MKYIYENNTVIIKGLLFKKQIDLPKITKVIWEKRLSFFMNEKKVLSCKAGKQSIELADMVYDQYNCEQMEYRRLFFENWRKISYKQFEDELLQKVDELKRIVDRYNSLFDFELCGEIVYDRRKTGAMYRVWGERDGKKIQVLNRKKCLQWGLDVHCLCPYIINKDLNKCIIAVYDKGTVFM